METVAQTNTFTVRDVKKSLSYFTDDDKLSVCKWIDHFEQTGTLLQWNNLQMFIYGKRMLKESTR